MERYSIILVCFVILLCCIYYIYIDFNRKPDKALIAKKQRDGLDNYLLPLAYHKNISSYHLHPYVKLVLHVDKKGEFVSYRNESLGKSIHLFFDTTFSHPGFLKDLILIQNNAPKDSKIINYNQINAKFRIGKNLQELRPRQITKYLKSLDKFAETSDLLNISNQYRTNTSTVATTFDFLKNNGFKEKYSFREDPNYFGIPMDLLIYKKSEIEIIVSLMMDRDYQSLYMIVLKNGTIIERASKQSSPKKTPTHLAEFKKHIQNNYC